MNEQRSDDGELLEFVRVMYEEKIPFNKELGFKVESMEPDDIRVRFEMADRLIGNYWRVNLQRRLLRGLDISS